MYVIIYPNKKRTDIMNIQKIIKVVRKAGKMFFDRKFDVEQKTSISDKVTSMDIKVEAFLKKELTALIKNSGFMGEESDWKNLDNEYVWVVDPIDGTTNFIRDMAASCVSVALLKDGEAYMGVVYNPYKNEVFYAERGRGAYLNGKRISVTDLPFEKSIFFTSFALYERELSETCFGIAKETYGLCDDVRRTGSAAIELCLVACGRGDLYFEIRLRPWDFAAGVLILNEAGGYAAIPGSDKMTYDKAVPIVAANTKENFDKLYKIVQKHLDK